MILDELFIESSTEWKIKVLELLIRRVQPSRMLLRHPIYGDCTDHFVLLVYLEECLALPAHQDHLHNV